MFNEKNDSNTKFVDEKFKFNTIFTPILLSIILWIGSIYILFI